MNAFCEDWKDFQPIEVVEIKTVRFKSLKYWSLAGFLIFAFCVGLFPLAQSPWLVAMGTAGGVVWIVFGAAYRRIKFSHC